MNQDVFMEASQAFSDCTAWRSRGYIPHFDRPGMVQSVTFRLVDAVPEKLISQWKFELKWNLELSASNSCNVVLRKRIDKYEDVGYGNCWLGDMRIATIVEQTMLFHDNERYRMIAWCIMPNHVHAIIEIMEGWFLDDILHSWKSYSAHEANRILLRNGRFWFPEYFDRFIRNPEHLAYAIEYVENNPVKLGWQGQKLNGCLGVPP
jgi:REP element-mobilizing transposase RayT